MASSFALQWLKQPLLQLSRWCAALRPGGALVLAVPCSGSFQIWHQAAERAGVPCSALPLPDANDLIAASKQNWVLPEEADYQLVNVSKSRLLPPKQLLGPDQVSDGDELEVQPFHQHG